MELGIPKTTIHRILTEKFGLKKVNSKFVPHKLNDKNCTELNIAESSLNTFEISKTS